MLTSKLIIFKKILLLSFSSAESIEVFLGCPQTDQTNTITVTLNTKKKYWFGQNQMGILLSEICSPLFQEFQTQSSSSNKKYKLYSLMPTTQSNEVKSVNNKESDSE